jgi:hypothetical protein
VKRPRNWEFRRHWSPGTEEESEGIADVLGRMIAKTFALGRNKPSSRNGCHRPRPRTKERR